MAANTEFSANTGIGVISTANSNLDGTGTTTAIITPGGSFGVLIKTITIKAQGNTTNGMVRFFIYNGTNKRLVSEVEIPPVTRSATDPSFGITIPVNFVLKGGWTLHASTEKAETFNIIAEGIDWHYYTASVRYECTRFEANTGVGTVSTANPNLNGAGTIVDVLTSSTAGNGRLIQNIKVKAQVNTTPGMVRIFIERSNSYLFMEIPVPAVTKSGTAHSFSHTVTFDSGNFVLGGDIQASTEKGESINVIAEAIDWRYPA